MKKVLFHRKTLFVAIALIAASPFAYNLLGTVCSSLGHTADPNTLSVFSYLKSLGRPVLRLPKAYWNRPEKELAPLAIRIKKKDFQRIQLKRKEALKKGLLESAPDDFVPATLRIAGKKIEARMRLKGDYIDHLEHANKWSFRVKTKGKDSAYGMRVFSIQHPKIRYYHQESVFLDLLRSEGIIAPRYEFVRTTLNGVSLGYMALEEHFSKELLENNGRPKGVILRLNEDLAFRAKNLGLLNASGIYNWRNAPIEPFQGKLVRRSKKLKRDAEHGIGLLRALIAKKRPASEVFDIEKIGKFIALLELWDNTHGFAWNNIRFYVHPETKKLEPVAYDLHPLATGSGSSHVMNSTKGLFERITSDPIIRKEVVNNLDTYIKKMIDGSIEKQLTRRNTNFVGTLISEFPLLYPVKFDQKKDRAKQLQAVTAKNYFTLRRYPEPEPLYPEIARTYRGPKKTLVVENLIPEKIVVELMGHSELIPGRPIEDAPSFTVTNIPLPEGAETVEVRIKGSTHSQTTPIDSLPAFLSVS